MTDDTQHNIDDGGPAFPRSQACTSQVGMALRDWFAGQALAGLTGLDESRFWSDERLAATAYCLANAMLAARKGGAV